MLWRLILNRATFLIAFSYQSLSGRRIFEIALPIQGAQSVVINDHPTLVVELTGFVDSDDKIIRIVINNIVLV